MSSTLLSQCRKALSQLFQLQLTKVEEVNHYLVELKTSIAQNNIEAINSNLSQNNLPIAEIENLENRRNQVLSQYGFEADNEGQLGCIKWCDDSDESLAKLYQLLSISLVQLQKSIQINSLLVNKGQDRIRRSVSLLTGQVNNERSSTYSKSGYSQGANNKRSLSQA